MNDPVPIREGVERLLRHLDAPRADTVQSIFEHWATLVGPGIAEHTRPVSVDEGCLVIAVDDPAWASHLQWSQDDLVTGLNEVLGADQITRIRAVVRRGR
ncbi:MAG: DciA family protein [Acidimicrobiales bacterium]